MSGKPFKKLSFASATPEDDRALRIAIFTGCFPVVSETFVIRHITGLIDLDQEVRIFSNARPESGGPEHKEVRRYNLLARAVYMNGPPEALVWEMPIRPFFGRTWLPGANKPIHNLARLAQVFPVLTRCFLRSPGIAAQLLSRNAYGYQAESLSGIYRLATLLREGKKFDIIHAHFGPNARSFRFARRLWKAPLVVSFHGYDFSTIPRKEGSRVYQSLWPYADLVIANSKYTKSRLAGLGCPPEKIRVLPVGLNPENFAFRPRTLEPGEPVKIITVARLVKIKGHELMLRALASLSDIPWKYDVVGDGPLHNDLAQLAKDLKINDRVEFHGSRTGDELMQLMDKAHLFALTSVAVDGDEEGQGLALQEAQACGLPVIATRHGAFPEGLIEDVTGVLAPQEDPQAMSKIVAALVRNSAKWPEMGKAGRQFVCEHYDIRQINAKLLDYYRELLNDPERGR